MFIYSFCQICVLCLQCILLWSFTALLVTLSLLRTNILLRIFALIPLNYNLLIVERKVKQFLKFKNSRFRAGETEDSEENGITN